MSLEIALALALIITCVIAYGICAFAKWHNKRFLRLPPPQPQVFRDAYKEHAHAVGHMRGVQ
jgi:hypothetical protein